MNHVQPYTPLRFLLLGVKTRHAAISIARLLKIRVFSASFSINDIAYLLTKSYNVDTFNATSSIAKSLSYHDKGGVSTLNELVP